MPEPDSDWLTLVRDIRDCEADAERAAEREREAFAELECVQVALETARINLERAQHADREATFELGLARDAFAAHQRQQGAGSDGHVR